MSTPDEQTLEQMRMDADNLYREENYTDRQVGSIQRMVPVTRAGDDDPQRQIVYLGHTQVMTPAGALPLNFELEANSLQEALDAFPQAANQALEDTMKQLEEMQRQQQGSGIVTPDQMGGGGMGGGQGGGMPGGGFQLR
jgi:hypothetical protein